MKKIILIIGIFSIFIGLNAQTIVSGDITGIWEPTGNPYIVTGNINVVDSLYIQPGVLVQFQAGGWKIEVGGGDKFLALGNAENPIVFEPMQGIEPGSWDKIYFNHSGIDDTISHCIIRYATIGILAQNCAPTIFNSTIHNNLEIGIYYNVDNGSTYEAQVNNCTVRDNGTNGIRVTGYNSSGEPNLVIEFNHCEVYNNISNGILVTSGTLWSFDNAYARADINNCLVFNNTNGVIASAYRGYADATLTNTIISFNNEYGVLNNDSHSHIDAGDLIYNCLWGNQNGNFSEIENVPAGFGLNGDYQNYNGDSCDVNFNIYNDPLFVDTLNANFNLQQNSKCIDAGTYIVSGEIVYDPDGTMPDIGANYYDQTGIGVKELLTNKVHIYPNPFTTKTTIEFENLNQSKYYLSIFNLSGHQVFERKNIKSDKIEIERNNLPSGIYFFELLSDKFKFSKKLIIR